MFFQDLGDVNRSVHLSRSWGCKLVTSQILIQVYFSGITLKAVVVLMRRNLAQVTNHLLTVTSEKHAPLILMYCICFSAMRSTRSLASSPEKAPKSRAISVASGVWPPPTSMPPNFQQRSLTPDPWPHQPNNERDRVTQRPKSVS